MSDLPIKKEQFEHVKCPKGMKVSKYIKGMAALMTNKTAQERRHFIRTMGLAAHEAQIKVRNASRDARSNSNSKTTPPVTDAE